MCCAFVDPDGKLYRCVCVCVRVCVSLSGLYNPSDKDAGHCVGRTGDFAL
jgi:hypothetical protein